MSKKDIYMPEHLIRDNDGNIIGKEDITLVIEDYSVKTKDGTLDKSLDSIEKNIGELSKLETKNKNNLVEAINEISGELYLYNNITNASFENAEDKSWSFSSHLLGDGNTLHFKDKSLVGDCSAKGVVSAKSPAATIRQRAEWEKGHKYFITGAYLMKEQDSAPAWLNIQSSKIYGKSHKLNDWEVKSIIYESDNTTDALVGMYIDTQNITTLGWDIYFDRFAAIDLTKIFGRGNEPTLSQMNTLMSILPNEFWEQERYKLTTVDILNWILAINSATAFELSELREMIAKRGLSR